MKPPRKQILTRVIILGSSLLLIMIIMLSLTTYVEREIRSTMNAHNAQASSIDVNLFTRSVRINKPQWSSAPDSLNRSQYSVRLNALTITGFSLYQNWQ